MFSLILVLLTIAFLSALAVVAVNYTPWWVARAQTANELASSGFATLERAYELAAASATPADTPPVPTEDADGGAGALLRPYSGFMPAAPRGMVWSYGHQDQAGLFEGLDYLCVSGNAVDQGEYNGLLRLARSWGDSQAVLSSTCGATDAQGTLSSFPAQVALTYYVQYVPGVEQ